MNRVFNKNQVLFVAKNNPCDYLKVISYEGYRYQRYDYSGFLIFGFIKSMMIKYNIFESIWYKRIKRNVKYVIILEFQFSLNYIKWLINKYPTKNFYFLYQNMVGKSTNIYPKDLPTKLSIWTYEKSDVDKYSINFVEGGYSDYYKYKGIELEKNFDVFYCGLDKGRSEKIFNLEKKLNSLGLKTKVIIVNKDKAVKDKRYSDKLISYEEVIKYDMMSKAILNYTFVNQEGITMRDYEAIYNKIKLITNNKNIMYKDFYRKNNIFILGVDDINILPNFLNTPYEEIDEKIINRYSFDSMVKTILSK